MSFCNSAPVSYPVLISDSEGAAVSVSDQKGAIVPVSNTNGGTICTLTPDPAMHFLSFWLPLGPQCLPQPQMVLQSSVCLTALFRFISRTCFPLALCINLVCLALHFCLKWCFVCSGLLYFCLLTYLSLDIWMLFINKCNKLIYKNNAQCTRLLQVLWTFYWCSRP